MSSDRSTIKQVAVHEARTRLSELLDDVERGDEVLITRRGAPVARLVAAEAAPQRSLASQRQRVGLAFRRLAELRSGVRLDIPLREAINSGRD